jgi:hypothetical protein
MDLTRQLTVNRAVLIFALLTTTGCIAPQPPVATVWQRLGIPQAGARMRDGLVNRRGNFPGLERKPPVLAIADPKNLEEAKPKMLQAAAEIKQDQDLKKQKIKALKFLGEVNCGCYNKDDKVEAAFLEALADCDPDVRLAAIEALDVAAGNCPKCCRTGCETTCCTEKIHKKLQDVAFGVEDGCYKEPVEEIRDAAKALFCKCPVPCAEVPPPEELVAPEPAGRPAEGGRPMEGDGDTASNDFGSAAFSLSDSNRQPTRLVSTAVEVESLQSRMESLITNPELLVKARTVAFNQSIGEILLQLPEAYDLRAGWDMVVVDAEGNVAKGSIVEMGGRRLLMTLDDMGTLKPRPGSDLRIGVISQ